MVRRLKNNHLNPPISDAELRHFGDKFNNIIPPSLLELLHEFNGGYFSAYLIKAPTNSVWVTFSMHEKYINIGDFYSIEQIEQKINSIIESCEQYEIDIFNEDFFLNSMIPFSDVDGFNCACICYKGENLGKIYLVEWYFHHQNDGTLPFPQQIVANSLNEFLDKMQPEEEDEEYQQLIKL